MPPRRDHHRGEVRATAWTSQTELRLLEVAHELGREGPVDVVPTFLGAHAVPSEYRSRPDGVEAYVRHVIEEQLPGVAAQGRARVVRRVLRGRACSRADQSPADPPGGRGLGLRPACTPTSCAPSGGAELAAELGALSADHLHAPSTRGSPRWPPRTDAGAPGRGDAAPRHHLVPHGRRLRPRPAGSSTRGVPVALGTDFNPGTSPTAGLPLVMTVACLEMKLSPAEALAAVTINAAHALRLGQTPARSNPAGRPTWSSGMFPPTR